MWPDEVVMKRRTIAAAKFKAECLSLLDEVAQTREEVVVTKRGKPVARLVPLERKRKGAALGVTIHGDIVGPTEPDATW